MKTENGYQKAGPGMKVSGSVCLYANGMKSFPLTDGARRDITEL